MLSEQYLKLWNDPALQKRINDGIEQHRKSEVAIEVRNAAGAPVQGVPIRIEQATSAFLFGANMFMVGSYPREELNTRYEDRYVGLFNAGTAALYWRDLEPQPGKLRFSIDSPEIRRRPPVDRMVNFARKHQLNINGHPLVWDYKKWNVPDWLSDEQCQNPAVWEQRIAQISERYGNVIPRWDVVNEVVVSRHRDGARPMPPGYARQAFTWAEKYLPETAFLMINDSTNAVWQAYRQEYQQLIRELIADGARVDGIAMQFHLFNEEAVMKAAQGQLHQPLELLAVMDQMVLMNRPLHISEITLPSPRGQVDGLELQAQLAVNFYRLWFSHPAVHAITWWNFPDGGAAPGEDGVDSGLLDENMQPKPAYTALQDLIHQQWRTNLTQKTDDQGRIRLRGFHGTYKLHLPDGTLSNHSLADVSGQRWVIQLQGN